MEIKEYVLGSLPPVGPIFGVPTTSLEPRVSPLTPSFLPSLTIDWAEVGHNGDWGVCFGVPTTCGGKFWDAHQLCWAKGPSQLAPSHSSHSLTPSRSLSLPPCCVLLPSCSLSLAMILCFVVPTTSFYYVLQCPPPLYYVLQWPPPIWGQGSFPAHSLCSQLVPSHSPLTPSRSLTPLLLPLLLSCSPHSSLTPLTPSCSQWSN